MKIMIGLDQVNSCYVLTGSIERLFANRRAKIFLKDYLKYSLGNDNNILIPYDEVNQEKILINIRDMLQKFGFSVKNSEAIEKTLGEFFEEEEKFTIFSQKANKIRNNNCKEADLKEFTISLTNNLKNRTLYPLQLLSAYHLAFSQNACNFSVPGAGKTSIVYGAFAYLNNLPPDNPKYVDKLLIIGPLSSFGPWELEYKECFGEEAFSKRLSGGIAREQKKKYFYSLNPSEITLLSYQGVNSIIDDLIYFLRKHRVMVVLDEAHKIKNTEGGIIAESVLSISKYCKSRVVLTGTPAPNGYEDLMNLFQFLWPSKSLIRYHKYQLKEMSENPKDSRVKELIDDITPYYIRIRKGDLKIPQATNNPPIIVDMDRTQREIYDFIEKSYMNHFMDREESNDIKGMLVKARLIRLMQAATNPNLLTKSIDKYFLEQEISDNLFVDDSEFIQKVLSYKKYQVPSKFKTVLGLVKNIISKNQKVIIWATFIQNMLDLQEFLDGQNIESKLLYGEIPVETEGNNDMLETREGIIREFHEPDSSFNVIIANPFAVAESISLHKVCHNAIYLERTFNASQFIQSKDRIHRYGLKPDDKINYYYILSHDSIDQTIHERLEFKEHRMNEIIENEPIPLFQLADEDDFGDNDLKALIRNYVNRIR